MLSTYSIFTTGYILNRFVIISVCNRQRDVTIVLDLSGSVDQVVNISLAFAARVIHGLDVDNSQVRVALVSFMSRASINFYLDTYTRQQEVLNALAFRMAGTRRTNTQEALRKMHSEVFSSNRGDRPGVRNIAVVITDGFSNIQRFNTAKEATNAHNIGIDTYAIGVGPDVDRNELNQIGSSPDSSHVILLRTARDVASRADTLLTRICQ